MFSLALEHLIKVTMNNHIYTFNGEIKRQVKGGAIGLMLTGWLACLYMIHWCKKLVSKVKDATADLPDFVLHMLKLYVDDGDVVSTALPPGSRLVNGKVVIKEEEVEVKFTVQSDEQVYEYCNQNVIQRFGWGSFPPLPGRLEDASLWMRS